jgi:hypothetical protein
MKPYKGTWCIPPFFHNFGTRWRRVVISYAGLFTLGKKPGPMEPLGRRMYWLQSQSRHFGEKKSFASPAIQSQDRPVCSLLTVPTTLARSEIIKCCEKFCHTFLFYFLIYYKKHITYNTQAWMLSISMHISYAWVHQCINYRHKTES